MTPAHTSFERVSVIIANYNQGDFVGQAVQSALNLDWPDVEVVVVDDGSTDHSRDVISTFGERVTILFQENQTQRVARNNGYALTSGDAVIHLDADDVLHPALAREAAKVWGPRVSKVQVLMQHISQHGLLLDGVMPRLRSTPSPAQVRNWLLKTSAYPTPPGSGNVYARTFLDRIFPLDDSCGPATDSYCLAAAPVLGDVVTLRQVLVYYRVHSANTSNMLARPNAFERAIERSRARHEYRSRLTDPGRPADMAVLFRSRELLQFRVANQRLIGRPSGLVGDRYCKLVADVLRSPFAPGPESPVDRILIVAWSLLTLAVPRRWSERLIAHRYAKRRSAPSVAQPSGEAEQVHRAECL